MGGEEDTSELAVNVVSFQPPPFYLKNPSSWFRQKESQFVLGRITSTVTKFHHVIAHLPEDIVADILTDDITEYDQLNKAVLDHLQANKHQLIEQALSAFELGNKRPSQLVSDKKSDLKQMTP